MDNLDLFTLLKEAFLSWFILPLESEVYWFALLGFGNHAMTIPTIFAVAGSVAAVVISYALGRLLAQDRSHMPLPEEKYQHAGQLANQYFVWLLIFSWLPFYGLCAFVLGFLRVSAVRFLATVLASRAIYYAFYLYQ